MVIKFKRQAETVFVTATPRETFGTLVGRLIEMINAAGGLKERCDPLGLEEETADAAGAPLVIPKPSFDTGSSDEEDVDIDTDATAETVDTRGQMVEAGQLTFGVPKDASDIYQGGYEAVEFDTSASLEKLPLTDYSVVVFALAGEEFEIVQPEPE